MANVRMPDGTVIKNVPEGVTQEDLLEQYSQLKAKRAQPRKYEVSEDTIYSPEGIPLFQPPSQAEMPAGVKKAERILTDIAGAPIRAAMGMAKPVVGAMEFAGVKAPSQAVSAIDTGMKQQTGPISTGASFLGDIGGGLGVVKALRAIPGTSGLATKFSQLSPVKQTAIGGAGLGLTMPTGKTYGDEGFFAAKAEEAGLGAAAGVALHKILGGASNLLAPQLERLKQLKASGVDTDKFVKEGTLGQILGGGTQTLEKWMQAVPFGGMGAKIEKGKTALKDLERQRVNEMRAELDASKQAVETKASKMKSKVEQTKEAQDLALKEQTLRQNQQRKAEKGAAVESLEGVTSAEKQAILDRHAAELAALEEKQSGFSTPIISKVLEPLQNLKNQEGKNLVEGLTLPKEARGHEAIKHAQQKVSEAYDAAIKDLGTVRTQPEIYAKIIQILEDAKSPASGIGEAEAERLSKYITAKFLEPIENMEGITGERWHQLFKELGEGARKQKTWQEGSVYRNIQQAWGDLASANDTSGKIKTINEAFRILQPIESASIKSGAAAEAGQFGPKELLSSAISEAPSTNVAARGEALLQPEAQKSLAAMKAEQAALKEKQAAELKAFEQQQAAIDAQNRARKTALESQYEEQKIADQLAAAQQKNKLDAMAKERQARIEAARKAQENRLSAEHDIGKESLKEAVEPVMAPKLGFGEGWAYRGTMMAPWIYMGRKALFNPEQELIPSALQYAMGEGFVPTGMTLAAPLMTRAYGAAQPLLKAAATAERPPIIKKAGENIRDYLRKEAPEAAAFGIPAAQQYQEEEQPAPGMARGGLAQYAKGGHATPAWQRKEGQNPEGGLNAAGRASYKRETGGELKRPQPEGGPRRDSFCARMKGMKKKLTSAETANDPDSRINKSLRAWNC